MRLLEKSTDVRNNWSQFMDDVKWVKPAFIKRNRDMIAVLSGELLEFILKEHNLTVNVFVEEDGSYTGSFNEIDMAANSTDFESLKVKLAEELIEYAEEYLNEFRLYFNSPNRKNHFPYIYRALLAGNDINKIKSFFSFSINLKKKVV
jgi:uncharacterized protein YbcC (UPF0753/DUF2309 family)